MIWNAQAGKWVPEPTVEEIVARTLAHLREKGLLLTREPAGPDASAGDQRSGSAGPTLGPRVCPQRNRYKRVLQGPRARRPLRSGQHPEGLTTLPPRRRDRRPARNSD